jgi:hypothetical protein
MTPKPPLAGTTTALEPGRNTVLSPEPTASSETRAADIKGYCATITGCIFTMGRCSKQQFLIDKGLDLSRKLIPQWKE